MFVVHIYIYIYMYIYISREKERLDTCNIGHGSMSYSRYISILAVPVAIAIVFQASLLIIVHSCKQPWLVGSNQFWTQKATQRNGT